MAKDCSTCFFFTDVPGLYAEDKSGICTENNEPSTRGRVQPEDGLNCMKWRPKSSEDMPTTSQTLAVRGVEQTNQSYKVLSTPLDLRQQPHVDMTVGNLLKISFDGEWLVTAIGKTALLAINPQTNIERVFKLGKEFAFERLRNT